jgi:hypothetical protein
VNAADVLDGAAELLDEKGWCRGDVVDAHGRHCAIGAIYAVAGVGQLAIDARRALAQEVTGTVNGSVTIWNDIQRDKRVVTRAMRRTARKLRGAKR